MNGPITVSPRLSPEDLTLVRQIGTRLRQIIRGEDVAIDDVDRLDELGILANLVNRAARELYNSRLRDREQRQELEQRLDEVQQLYHTQRQLLQTIKELSAPVLAVAEDVLLMPLIGVVDSDRAAHIITALLDAASKHHAKVVILDVSAVATIDTAVASVLIHAAQALKLLGSGVILCGITPEVAQVIVSLGIEFSMLTPCNDLQAALKHAATMRLRSDKAR